jgi:isocitrate dehydrogenase kinase/phosphatase
MTVGHVTDSRLASLGARVIADAYRDLRKRFDSITARAQSRFEARDWQGVADDALERLHLYSPTARATAAEVESLLGSRALEKAIWAAMKAAYSGFAMERQDFELVETFFNSITRRTFATVGVDPRIEFVETDFRTPPTESLRDVSRIHRLSGTLPELVRELLLAPGFRAPYARLDSDSADVARRIASELADSEIVSSIEVATEVFYRSKGAYLVGRVLTDRRTLPMALSLSHEAEGIGVDAVVLAENDLSILFSFAHSYFHVESERPYDLIRFINELVPRKRSSELYISIGHARHGKTELFRELRAHLEESDDVFVEPPGKKGLVMSVFTLPGFEMVFKVIKDNFPPQKSLTPTQVMEKYRLVFHHDRAGRLVDSQSYEHLEVRANRFDPELLDSLLSDCSRSVRRVGDRIDIALAYVQRRVEPLDVYLREVGPERARRAVADYGDAIKDLAITGIFPGDLLLKNFGVTRHGRVVFYDYDELTEIGNCKFRKLPEPSTIDEAMSDTPWFPIGPDDVFPGEFPSFLGLSGSLQEAFVENHDDLFDASWWQGVQKRVGSGEIASVYPYRRELRLGPKPE